MANKYFSGIQVSEKLNVGGDSQYPIIKIEHPESNMQTDFACFESIAIVAKAKCNYKKITLDFEPIDWTGKLKNLCSEQAHYMRFLFRLWKFTDAFDWAEITEDKRGIVEQFKSAFNSAELVTNIPEKQSTFNKKKGMEHTIENFFAKKEYGQAYFKDLFYNKTGTRLESVFNQFPNGLFDGEVAGKHRIFPTGYFDIWGINNSGELCLFELKKDDGNNKLGLLSELLFYATYAHDVLLGTTAMPESEKTFRGYPEMKKLVRSGKKVNAYFLVGKIHPSISANKDGILKILNAYRPGQIEFSFIEYDFADIKPIVDTL